MAKKRSFSNTKSQKVKNREYKVAITRLRLNDAVFLDALLKYHDIRDCAVKLHRMNDPTNHSLVEKKQKKKLLRSTEKKPQRSLTCAMVADCAIDENDIIKNSGP